MVITVSHQGYIKRLPASTYRLQRRGGRGLQGMNTKEEDWVEHLFLARTHDFLLFFTTRGFCYRLKVYEIPQAMRVARGKPMVNLIGLKPGEQIAALVPVRCFDEERHLLFGTRKGVVKKTALAAYGNVRVNGLNAINVLEGDELIAVRMTGGDDDVIIATREGLAIRFHESDVRPMGRATTGVRGISLAAGDTVVGVVVVGKETAADATLLVVSERGLGKRTRIDAYRLQRRGGKGVINIRTNGKTGKVIAIMQVLPDDELMLITRNGIVNRQAVQDIRVIGRATQGVRLLSLGAGDRVTDVARLVAEGEAELGELAVELGDLPVPGLEPVVGLPPDVPEASDS